MNITQLVLYTQQNDISCILAQIFMLKFTCKMYRKESSIIFVKQRFWYWSYGYA